MSITVAFGKERLTVSLDGKTCVRDIKDALCTASGVAVEYQRFMVKGKEQKDGSKSLVEIGVTDGVKAILMTTPAYVPATPKAEVSKPTEPESGVHTRQIIETAIPGTAEDEAGLVVVRQGRTHYRVKTSFELTFGHLRDHMATLTEVPLNQLRFLAKGKEQANDVVLKNLSSSSLTVLLLFREGYHRTQDALEWLRSSEAELTEIERNVKSTLNRVRHRLQDAVEISFLLQQAGDFLEVCHTSLDSLNTTAEWDPFRLRLKELEKDIEELRAVKL